MKIGDVQITQQLNNKQQSNQQQDSKVNQTSKASKRIPLENTMIAMMYSAIDTQFNSFLKRTMKVSRISKATYPIKQPTINQTIKNQQTRERWYWVPDVVLISCSSLLFQSNELFLCEWQDLSWRFDNIQVLHQDLNENNHNQNSTSNQK